MGAEDPSGSPPPQPQPQPQPQPEAVPTDPAERDARRRTSPPPAEPRGVEGLLAEILRRGMSAGRGPLEKVGESIFPREVTSSLIHQLGDIRSGVVKAVALEVGRFLREADIASEVRKVLLGLDIEATVKLRFNQREDGTLEPEVEEVPPKRRPPRKKTE
jgi:hypothetical protein